MVTGNGMPLRNKSEWISTYFHASVVFHEKLKQMSNSN